MTSGREIAQSVINTILDYTRAYFRDHLNIAVKSETSMNGVIEKLRLRNITSIMGIGGDINILVAFSFDKSLSAQIFDIETKNITVEAEERHVFLLDVAAETLNTVLGYCTANLAKGGGKVLLSAPVVIEEARCLHRPKDAAFHSTSLETGHGRIDINFIAPRDLFDDKLNAIAL